jgi:hypothetical protein
MAYNFLLPGRTTDFMSQPTNGTWAPTNIAEQAVQGVFKGFTPKDSPAPAYNPSVTSIGVNQNAQPPYNPYAMWGGLPTTNGVPSYGSGATSLFKPSGNQPGYASSAPMSTTSRDNSLLSMGFQRGVAR